MEDIVNYLASLLAICKRADISLNEAKVNPLLRRHHGLHFVKIVPVASRKVIQANNALIQFEQRFQSISTDKPSNARHKLCF